jgi:hypothetical protein
LILGYLKKTAHFWAAYDLPGLSICFEAQQTPIHFVLHLFKQQREKWYKVGRFQIANRKASTDFLEGERKVAGNIYRS